MPIEEWWESTGKAPAGVKWVNTSKSDKENPECRCESVAKEIKKDKREDLFGFGQVCQGCVWIWEMWCMRTFMRRQGEECM